MFAEDWRRGEALDSLISQGCIVSGSRIRGSILCPNVRVHSFCHDRGSILMPGVRVGRHARIRKAIIDRDVDIPRGALIGFNPEEDQRRATWCRRAAWWWSLPETSPIVAGVNVRIATGSRSRSAWMRGRYEAQRRRGAENYFLFFGFRENSPF